MDREMDRKGFIKRAGVGAGVLALPAAFGAPAAFALPPNGHRIFVAVAFSEAPALGDVAHPRIALNICGNFKPDAGWINGGGSWVLLDWPGGTGTAKFISSGLWRPTELVNYQNFTPTVGLIQASLVDLRADFEGLADNVSMTLICNVGPAGILTGQPEGWKATIPPYGLFAPIGVGITHTSVEGVHV